MSLQSKSPHCQCRAESAEKSACSLSSICRQALLSADTERSSHHVLAYSSNMHPWLGIMLWSSLGAEARRQFYIDALAISILQCSTTSMHCVNPDSAGFSAPQRPDTSVHHRCSGFSFGCRLCIVGTAGSQFVWISTQPKTYGREVNLNWKSTYSKLKPWSQNNSNPIFNVYGFREDLL